MRSLIALTLALGLIAGCDRQTKEAPQPAPGATASPEASAPAETGKLDVSKKGSAAPTDAFTAPDGTKITLAAFKGKPALVNLWATWCVPCVREMPTLDALAAREAGKLQVVTISQDLDGAAKVGPYFAKNGFKAIKPYLDPENGIGFKLSGETGLPATVLYDADGKEVWRVAGGMDWTGEKAGALLKQVPGL